MSCFASLLDRVYTLNLGALIFSEDLLLPRGF
jgi:hypothetical protein